MKETKTDVCLAVDVGNSAIKIARCLRSVDDPLPEVQWTRQWPDPADSDGSWMGTLPAQAQLWFVSSVSRPALGRWESWVRRQRPQDQIRILTYRDLPLTIDVHNPTGVGMDRLAAAVGANLRRPEGHAAIIIDAGTAVTVDAVDHQGVFQGGFILPGPQLAARALRQGTDLLPEVDLDAAEPLPDIGKNTHQALRGGILLELVGGIRFLVDHITKVLGPPVSCYVAGGSLRQWTAQLLPDAQYVPDLVLSGIAYAGWWSQERPK